MILTYEGRTTGKYIPLCSTQISNLWFAMTRAQTQIKHDDLEKELKPSTIEKHFQLSRSEQQRFVESDSFLKAKRKMMIYWARFIILKDWTSCSLFERPLYMVGWSTTFTCSSPCISIRVYWVWIWVKIHGIYVISNGRGHTDCAK